MKLMLYICSTLIDSYLFLRAVNLGLGYLTIFLGNFQKHSWWVLKTLFLYPFLNEGFLTQGIYDFTSYNRS